MLWIIVLTIISMTKDQMGLYPMWWVKNYNMCFLNKLYLRCGKMCLICSKTKFITNITNTNVARIHTFFFLQKTHIYHYGHKIYHKTYIFTKINIDPVAGPKSEILRSCGGTIPPKVLKLYFFVYFLIKCVSFVVKYV